PPASLLFPYTTLFRSWVQADIEAGKALSKAPLPAWVFDGRDGVHTPEGSWSPSQNRYLPRSTLPVYARQHFPESLAGDGSAAPRSEEHTSELQSQSNL